MIKEIFTGNVLTKLMAFVMAIALWLYAINRHTGDVREMVNLNISVPEGITIQEQSAKEVALHLRGPQHIIDNLSVMIKANKILAKYTDNCKYFESIIYLIKVNFLRCPRIPFES
ncbi:MAG: hypothetical protein AAB331_05115 [Planctomycetota bacterium]